ncbi:unnamed protein product [Kuraishia capsulata CBS 1993]|uniref:Wbp11/ELF5/Saf1 N-terminal domain-containing protein n=1 Tax=Kuraishia capsulata CBS 1993 TaxID=1382522 RepID=W6MGE8_9ASCO|nr:uncharacterized protein KUCA_T00001126001 [Kuraishia capsulata CBS 1993]CDK25159.1 unnamed protein product [Kuraishia capsulata CBS 1993]
MVKRTLNPVEAERRKQKLKEHRKSQARKVEQRLVKIADRDPGRLRDKLKALEEVQKEKGRLNHTEQRTLDNLRRDLRLLETNRKGSTTSHTEHDKEQQPQLSLPQTDRLGKASIFYDPEFNPYGKAPNGYENVKYPLVNPYEYPDNKQIVDIPMPEGDPPRFYKVKDYDASLSVDEVRRDFVKESIQAGLLPTALMGSIKRTTAAPKAEVKPKPIPETGSDSEFGEYASEEEEYRKKRRHVELEDVEDEG